MATQAPDPSTLRSWEDVFQYPLPVVRRVEQQLRQNIDDNRNKLRSLVGSSYRDLLGTAERIVEMDEQLREVEANLGGLGRKCNVRRLERVAENHERMKTARGEAAQARSRTLAQTKALQNLVTTAARLIKSGGSGNALPAAKLLVLARLVHKSLAESGESAPPVLDVLRRKLGQTRKRLLSYLGRSLVKLEGDKTATVDNLTAYSLITSSAPKDVLRYFLQVRFEQLEGKAETPTEDDILHMLDLYSQTLLDTRELFPRRFADALFQLSKTALMRDDQVRAIPELGLDVYEQWIPTDVRHFTPWVRHDQLTSSEVGDALGSWTRQAQNCLLEGLAWPLNQQQDPLVVLDVRQKVLSKYLSLSARLRGEGHMKTINAIRKIFLDRLEQMSSSAASTSEFEEELRRSGDSVSIGKAPDLWSLATDNLDLSGGAVRLREAVMESQNGRDDVTKRIIERLDTWTARLDSFGKVIAHMRAAKWDDDIDVDLDDISDGESLQTILSKQDPQQLQTRLHKVTSLALGHLYQGVEQVKALHNQPEVLIRITREVDRRRRCLIDQLPGLDTAHANQDVLTTWQGEIARSISKTALEQFADSKYVSSHVAVSLWDGTPPQPVQPSPAAFRFLTTLHGRMAEARNDLWSPQAVEHLKHMVSRELGERLAHGHEKITSGRGLTNGHATAVHDESANTSEADGKVNGEAHPAEAASTDNIKKDDRNGDHDEVDDSDNHNTALLQQAFDVLYLQHVLRTGGSATVEGDGLRGVAQALQRRLELDGAAQERLRKSAQEYWRRTYLLFGLLAPGQS